MENNHSTPGGSKGVQRPDSSATSQPTEPSATPAPQEPVDLSPPSGSFPDSSSTTPPATPPTNTQKRGYYAQTNRVYQDSKKIPKWAIIVPVAVVVLAGLGWAGYTFLIKPGQSNVQTAVVSGNEAVEQVNVSPQTTAGSGGKDAPVVTDSKEPEKPLQKVEEASNKPAAKEAESASQNAPQVTPDNSSEEKPVENVKQKGSKEFEYGIYTGELLGGLPHGEGTMRYSRRQQISRHDRQKRTAEAGESVNGQWYKGDLTNGTLYDKNGAKKAALIIGRAE